MSFRIRIFCGRTFGGIWETILPRLGEALERRGFPVEIVGLGKRAPSGSCDLSIGINEWGLNFLARGTFHFAWCVDHPVRHFDPAQREWKRKENLFGAACPSWVEWFREQGISNAFFFPHHLPDEFEAPSGRNPAGPVLFPGSIGDFRSKPREWEERMGVTGKILQAVAEEGRTRYPCDLRIVLYDVLKRMEVEISKERRPALELLLFREVELYLRNRLKAEFVAAASKFPLLVCGSPAWRAFLPEGVVLRSTVPFSHLAEILSECSVLINVVPPQTPRGTHERPLLAALAGLPCLTTPTVKLREIFGDTVTWVGKREELEAALDSYFRGTADTEEKIEGARERVRGLTISAAAEKIVRLIERGFEPMPAQ
ncbi:MAG: hypothetical protein D6679_12065 [Candidatus Hydrogenedentota bacterium]|nr:MAG: hypothetical protein D6679_12065 [Candidatus Hydrogenedentota bacterium]